MITIVHESKYEVRLLATPFERKQALPHVRRIERFAYFVGDTKPNYPMPAIPNETDIMPTYVVRFEWHGPKQYGEYCVVSKLWDKPITQN